MKYGKIEQFCFAMYLEIVSFVRERTLLLHFIKWEKETSQKATSTLQ